jgi:3-deoxy-D-manno-octulosonate 8-phosphate phosphatase (KDO 8-P phosphatase)
MIKLVVFDFDGVFTDGRINFGPNGYLSKSYNGKDSYALKILKKNGIMTGVITNDKFVSIENAPHIFSRLDRSSIGVDMPKEEILLEWLDELSIELSEVAYIGDDIPDIEILKMVGLSGCPADAIDEVREVAKFNSSKKGGNGAVREFVDHIVAMQFKL